MGILKIFTFNVRICIDKGANDFELRKHRIAELINREKPDIIGFQEAKDSIREELRGLLDGYYLLGCGRGANYQGESAAVAVRIDRLELLALDNFWMSATPDVAGSRYGLDQSSCPRLSTALRLVEKGSDKPFWFVNTHLDHVGADARLLGAVQLLQYVSQKDEPCVLTGDFNALPDSKEIRAILDSNIGLVDCTAGIDGSFHDYGRLEKMIKIDYIFTNLPCDVEKTVAYADDAPNGTYYSDHLALCAYIEV